MSASKSPLGVFGAGWVGLVTGASFAELGHRVVVCDVVPEKIEGLRAGHVPFHEPGLVDLLAEPVEYIVINADRDTGLPGGRREHRTSLGLAEIVVLLHRRLSYWRRSDGVAFRAEISRISSPFHV